MKYWKHATFGAVLGGLALLSLGGQKGALNPNVTQANIDKTVCVSGYTATIRPPVSYTNALKVKLMKENHLSGSLGDYELDHRISLVLGGAPSDPQNLWMQPYPEARYKDQVESYLHREVCAGRMTLKEAQDKVVNHWQEIYQQLSHNLGAIDETDQDDN